MSEKVVLRVVVNGDHLVATDPAGVTRQVAFTPRLVNKMDGLSSAYFYARLRPDGVRLDRFAPVHAWQAEA